MFGSSSMEWINTNVCVLYILPVLFKGGLYTKSTPTFQIIQRIDAVGNHRVRASAIVLFVEVAQFNAGGGAASLTHPRGSHGTAC